MCGRHVMKARALALCEIALNTWTAQDNGDLLTFIVLDGSNWRRERR